MALPRDVRGPRYPVSKPHWPPQGSRLPVEEIVVGFQQVQFDYLTPLPLPTTPLPLREFRKGFTEKGRGLTPFYLVSGRPVGTNKFNNWLETQVHDSTKYFKNLKIIGTWRLCYSYFILWRWYKFSSDILTHWIYKLKLRFLSSLIFLTYYKWLSMRHGPWINFILQNLRFTIIRLHLFSKIFHLYLNARGNTVGVKSTGIGVYRLPTVWPVMSISCKSSDVLQDHLCLLLVIYTWIYLIKNKVL